MQSIHTIKILGYLGILGAILVGMGEYLLHYSPQILGNADDYEFFRYVSLSNLSRGHFLAVSGIPFYFAGYLHLYFMLKSGSENWARAVLLLGFIAFAVGGVWIGSRVSIGQIVHLKSSIAPITYTQLLSHYTAHVEILVQVLRVVITALSICFCVAILKGGTYYAKWMAIFSPIVILIGLVIIGNILPLVGQHVLPILMNFTHFILFTLSLYQLNHFLKPLHHA
ncbi:DUF6796 family protein [Arenibacter sp. GZD96]|uniref:DUF6796 family protein n=1 Tax=Aurantibrevibacter litoralis TaxID=3106030 RepID=UPI002AFF08D4|nr:DUF6796 family protein [Arenibacter sp. GZD-96]MEA1786733.1 DUF6796 family protein [Arenibacter sp. GZD-96]